MELHAREARCRAARAPRRRPGRGPARPARTGCRAGRRRRRAVKRGVEAHPPGGRTGRSRAGHALVGRVPAVQRQPEQPGQHLVAEADREQRPPAGEPRRSAAPRSARHLRVVRRRAGRPGRGRPPPGRSGRGRPGRVHGRHASTASPSARSWWASMPVNVSSRVDDQRAAAAPAGSAPAGARSSSQNRARSGCGRPARPRTAGSVSSAGRRTARRRRPAAGRARPGRRRPWRASRPPRRPAVEWRTSVAPTGTRRRAVRGDLRGADQDRRVQRLPARVVVAEQRQHAGVVAAAAALVPGDHPAGVLDRAAGDGRREHRLAQHVPHVQRAAAGQQVLGVGQVRHLA